MSTDTVSMALILLSGLVLSHFLFFFLSFLPSFGIHPIARRETARDGFLSSNPVHRNTLRIPKWRCDDKQFRPCVHALVDSAVRVTRFSAIDRFNRIGS